MMKNQLIIILFIILAHIDWYVLTIFCKMLGCRFMDIFYDGGTFVNKKENNSWIIQTFGPLIYLTSMTLKTFHSEMEVTRS